ncbi:MAG: hypothetical protein ABSG53_21840, partial [Thermoguttaceae bacterium]
VFICGPAVWADENPKVAKTGEEVQRQAREPMRVEPVQREHREPMRVPESPEVAKTNSSDVKNENEPAVAVPEATGGEITVSWKGGQLVFPETSSKESGLKLRCTGNVMIEGKGLTVKANDLDATIEGKGVIPKASDVTLRCAGTVVIEWKGFTAIAADLQYNAEKDLFTLSSGGKSNGCVFRSKNKDGTTSVLIADQISLSPSSSKVSCVGVKEYKVVDASTPIIPTASFAPGPVFPATGTYIPATVPHNATYPASGPSFGTESFPSAAPVTSPPASSPR